MKELFVTGGLLFMSILTLLLIVMICWMMFHFIRTLNANEGNVDMGLRYLSWGKSIGLFAMITGILGQMLGLYQAFFAIERASDISPALIFGGIKVSMISTIYGVFIYLLSLLLWFSFSYMLMRRNPAE